MSLQLTTGASPSFLVFSGGNDRAVLGFLRALRLCGQRAHIVARTPDDRILRTNFREDVRWVRPTHALTRDVFAECIRRVRGQAGDVRLVLLPSTEYFNAFLLRHRAAIEAMGCKVPLVDARLYAQLTEKNSAVKFFSMAGLSVPLEIPAFDLTPPVVAKPTYNVSATGQSLYPHLLDTRAKLDAFLAANDTDDYFFQEYLQGDSLYLVFHLSGVEGGDSIWSQRNLLQQPGGKSMLLAETSDFHHSETAKRIVETLRAAGFRGLGMLEFIQSNGRDVFIEMNPRIWGPAQFCIDQGPALLQAFIGEALFGDPMRFATCLPQRRRPRYFWLSGLMETISSGQMPTGHSSGRPLPLVILRNLACDLYLRKDSWRCFTNDLANNLRWRSS